MRRLHVCPPHPPAPSPPRGEGEPTRVCAVTPHDHGSAIAEPTVVGGYASFSPCVILWEIRQPLKRGWNATSRHASYHVMAGYAYINPLAGLTPAHPHPAHHGMVGYAYINPLAGLSCVRRLHVCPPHPPAPSPRGGGEPPCVRRHPPRPRLCWRRADGRRGLCFFFPLRYPLGNTPTPETGLEYHIPVTHPTMLWQVMLTSTP